MEKEGPRRALLLGLLEVRQPLGQLDMDERSKLYTLCHGASVAGEKDEAGLLGWQEHGLMGVEVTLDQEHLHVTSNEISVSRHSLMDVGAIVAMPCTEGHLVVVGQCQVKGLQIAVVLDMMSQADAHRLVEDLRERLSRLAPPSVQPSTPQDTARRTPLPSAPPITEMDPFINLPHTPSTNASLRPDQTSVHRSSPPRSTTTLSPTFVTQPPSSSSHPFIRPPLPVKPDSRVPNTPAFTPPASTPSSSTPPVSLRKPFTRPALNRPQCTPPEPPLSMSNPPPSTRRVPIPPVFTPPVSSQSASSQPASTISASTSPVTTLPASTRPIFTPLMPKPALPTRPETTFTVPSRQSPLMRVPTPLVPLLPVPSTSAPTATVSSSSVSTPSVPIPPESSPRVKTPLVITLPKKTVPKPAVARRPISFPSASSSSVVTTTVSITALPTTPVSPTQLPTIQVTSAPIFTTPVSTTPAPTTPKFSCPSSITSVPSDWSTGTAVMSRSRGSAVSAFTVPAPLPPVSIAPAVSQDPRRHSVASSSSLEEDNLKGSWKTGLILGTLNVEESEYLFIPGMKKVQEEDSLSSSSTSSSLEHELSAFLENEHRYLDTLRRIKDARKAVKSELQNLLRRNESLVDFHEDFIKELHQEFPSCSGIAQVFLSHKEDLNQYRYYLMNAPKVSHQLGKQTEEVKLQHPTLEADLKSSWKRLHYYFMTFDKLIKVVSDEEQPLVQEVADLLRDMNRQGDSAILIDAVSGAPFPLDPLLNSLLLHGLFTIKDSSGALKTKAKYHVLLFEEMIVITSPKKEIYQYKDHLPIRQLNLRQANGDEATFVLDFVHGGNKKNRRFAFKSRQKEATDAWVQEITRLRLENAEEVKHHRNLRYGVQ